MDDKKTYSPERNAAAQIEMHELFDSMSAIKGKAYTNCAYLIFTLSNYFEAMQSLIQFIPKDTPANIITTIKNVQHSYSETLEYIISHLMREVILVDKIPEDKTEQFGHDMIADIQVLRKKQDEYGGYLFASPNQ